MRPDSAAPIRARPPPPRPAVRAWCRTRACGAMRRARRRWRAGTDGMAFRMDCTRAPTPDVGRRCAVCCHTRSPRPNTAPPQAPPGRARRAPRMTSRRRWWSWYRPREGEGTRRATSPTCAPASRRRRCRRRRAVSGRSRRAPDGCPAPSGRADSCWRRPRRYRIRPRRRSLRCRA